MRTIILASTSRYRHRLMDRLGVPYHSAAPRYEESMPAAAIPRALVMKQAGGKAQSVASDHPDALIIGSDQLVAFEGRLLGKPGTPARAIEQLTRLRGRAHELLTAVTVLDSATGRSASHLDVTEIRLRDLADDEIAAYVRRENPVDCAGAYRSEGLGIALFDHQRGDDPTAVIGLPLIALTRLLADFGVNVLTGSDAPGAP